MKLELTELECVIVQLDLILNYEKKLSINKTQLLYLAYFYLYGQEGKDMMYKEGLSLNKAVWHNQLRMFRKLGIIEGKKHSSRIIIDLNKELDVQIRVKSQDINRE